MGGLCECGCGGQTARAKRSRHEQGILKGDYARFIRGHHSRKYVEGYVEEDRGHQTLCWVWHGQVRKDGYGVSFQGGGPRLAHRVYYEDVRGSIPAGLQLDHLCRVRSCVRPDHLEPVTQKVNSRRGLGTKLSDEQVLEIRAAYTGERGQQTRLAEQYGVRAPTIHSIVRGKHRIG